MVGRCWVDLKQIGMDIVGWICSNLGWTQTKKREREKLIKYCIQSYSNRAYMHYYCSTFVYIHNFASTDISVFWVKCVKLTTFCILHNFTTSDAVVLNIPIINSQCSQTLRANQGNRTSKTSLQENPNRRKNGILQMRPTLQILRGLAKMNKYAK